MTQETRRRIAAGQRTPRFSRGIEHEPLTGDEQHVGRFSDGIEVLPEGAGDKPHVGRFSDGIERLPEAAGDKPHVGRFSEGVERGGDAVASA